MMIDRDKMERVLKDYPFFQKASSDEREKMLDAGCAVSSLHDCVVEGFTFASGKMKGEDQVRVGFVLRDNNTGTKILVHVPYLEVLDDGNNFVDVTNEGLPDCDDENVRVKSIDAAEENLLRGISDYMKQGDWNNE